MGPQNRWFVVFQGTKSCIARSHRRASTTCRLSPRLDDYSRLGLGPVMARPTRLLFLRSQLNLGNALLVGPVYENGPVLSIVSRSAISVRRTVWRYCVDYLCGHGHASGASGRNRLGQSVSAATRNLS